MKKTLLILVCHLTIFTFSFAATVTWDGDAGTTDWMDATNWDTDMIPTSADDVDLDGSTVILTANTTVQRVYAGGSSHFTINAGVTLTVDGFSGDDEGIEVQTSATLVNDGIIDISNISGTNGDGFYNKGIVTNNGSISIHGIGQHGIYAVAGTFTNESGGSITITNIGQDDADADYIYVDDANSGTLFGTFTNNGTITITVTTADDGIHVSDNTTFNNTSIINISLGAGAAKGDEGVFVEKGGTLNNNANGVITINSSKDHGMATNSNGTINNNLGGTINIDAITDDQIFLDGTSSFNNSGTINLTNGTDFGLYVTDNSIFTNTSTGQVNVTDATDHGVYIDGNGTTTNAVIDNSGTITVNDGGSSSDGLRMGEGATMINNSGAFLLINNSGADGIQMDGSTQLDNSGTISIDGTAAGEEALELVSGSIFNNLNGGLYMVANCGDDGIEVNGGATLNNDGAIRIDGSADQDIETFGGAIINNSATATYAPGSSPGDMIMKGDFDFGASTITFEITGTTATTDYDQILNGDNAHTATISGATAHLDWGAFVPAVGDCFKIVDGSGTASGPFASVTNSNSNYVYTVDYSNTDEVEICVTALLPVELIHFKGEKTDQGLELDWATASETNNEGFDIERSDNGYDWEAIGYEAGNGNSFELTQYTFVDETPINGTNFYRLKQNDFDGEFEYSKVIALDFESEENAFRISPNPVKDVLYFETNQEIENLEIQLFDSTGRLLWMKKGEVQEIPFGEYTQGVYFLKVISPLNQTIQKIIKN